MLYTLKLYIVTCQLYFSQTGKNFKIKLHRKISITPLQTNVCARVSQIYFLFFQITSNITRSLSSLSGPCVKRWSSQPLWQHCFCSGNPEGITPLAAKALNHLLLLIIWCFRRYQLLSIYTYFKTKQCHFLKC